LQGFCISLALTLTGAVARALAGVFFGEGLEITPSELETNSHVPQRNPIMMSKLFVINETISA
jgi:hypothetical protein